MDISKLKISLCVSKCIFGWIAVSRRYYSPGKLYHDSLRFIDKMLRYRRETALHGAL